MELHRIPNDIRARICYHRGFGYEENSLSSLSNALNFSPFLLEFDIQLYDGAFVLGHPPERSDHLLTDALAQYEDTKTIPKIDLKFIEENKDSRMVLEKLFKILTQAEYSELRKILINIDGEGSVEDFLERERIFLALTGHSKNIDLNVDLNRYKDTAPEVVDQHLQTIKKCVFSISPEISNPDLDRILSCTRTLEINQVHFWLLQPATVSLDKLNTLLEWGKSNNLEVYFDISPSHLTMH